MREAEDDWLKFLEAMCEHCASEMAALGAVEIVMEAAEKGDRQFRCAQRTAQYH